MKICIYSDVHWSTTSSIVRQQGTLFSTRLEHLINSMNWVNSTAVEQGCELTICAGDFMHKPQLSDEELTALKQINWADMQHYFLCGNHESSVSSLCFSSVMALESDHRHIIADQLYSLVLDDTKISFIPYIIESNRESIDNYIKPDELGRKHIIISHNDIAGINYCYGGFESKAGFSIKEIEDNCDLYLNGHLHNQKWITDKILNVGSLSAHNFTNDSLVYNYGLWILDTEDLSMTFIENPYSFNFYKFEIKKANEIKNINKVKKNAVVSVVCTKDLFTDCKDALEKNSNIITHRLAARSEVIDTTHSIDIEEIRGTDHIQRLIQFCHNNIENTEILEAELAEICK